MLYTDSRDMLVLYHLPLHHAFTSAVEMVALVPEIMDTSVLIQTLSNFFSLFKHSVFKNRCLSSGIKKESFPLKWTG
jgi:hypothetical protein